MRVTLVVDALRPPLGGIGRYTWELCRRLPQQPGLEQLGFFAWGRFLDDPEAVVRGDPLPRPLRVPRWIRSRLRNRRLEGSLVHGPNYFLPREVQGGIITVHDLSVFRYPETHPRERVESFEREFLSSLARARHIITDTETVKQEIVTDFSLAPEQISVVPLGVDGVYRPRTPDELGPLARIGLQPGGYALCVSTLEPRKRVSELVRAWGRLPQRMRTSTPLVLAGSKGWLSESLHEEIREGVAGGWLKHLGFVPEDTLPLLYSGAGLFIYPSIYEGFGLPPLEAMASGVPVLVPRISCFPEVCGDAVGYINPDDPDALLNSIVAALEDAEWRSDARGRGLARARSYSWDACARQTARVYQAVAGER
jgi:alpha-1,3-rhamnosyl/mannosyltransferase